MSIFNPEALLLGLFKQMGVGPEQVQQVFTTIQGINQLCQEVEGFKLGMRQLVQHFDTRLNAIEARLERIEHPPQAVANLSLENGVNNDVSHHR